MRKTAVFIIISCCAMCCPANGQTRIITTVAGSSFIFPANVTTALDAPLGLAAAVAVDAQGNFYAADSSNNIVVEVSPSGVLRIAAGNGVNGFSGDGGPAASVRDIDRREKNRSKFIAEAVRHELERRRRAELRRSLENAHPESAYRDRRGRGRNPFRRRRKVPSRP